MFIYHHLHDSYKTGNIISRHALITINFIVSRHTGFNIRYTLQINNSMLVFHDKVTNLPLV